MQSTHDSALKVAEFLLQIKAVQLKPHDPFTWASGWKSPIYCDNRKTLSYPKVRTYIRQEFVKLINSLYGKPDVIAGVATGGIAMGALIAQELGVPFVYVRAEAKNHGLENRVEGVVESGQSVVVVEDLISTGNSSLSAVGALRAAGCNVKGMVAIFSYGFEVATENFHRSDCAVNTLTNYQVLIEQAQKSGFVSANEIESLQSWRRNPQGWTPEMSKL